MNREFVGFYFYKRNLSLTFLKYFLDMLDLTSAFLQIVRIGAIGLVTKRGLGLGVEDLGSSNGINDEESEGEAVEDIACTMVGEELEDIAI